MNEFMLMFLVMSPADQSAFSARIHPAAHQVAARPAVDSASSRSVADLLSGLHVGRPSATAVEPAAANEAGASVASVHPSSGGTPGEIFGSKAEALAKRNNFTLTPEGRASLLFAFANGIDASPLIIQVPGAAASSKICDELTAADQREYDLWNGSISVQSVLSSSRVLSKPLPTSQVM